MSPCLAIPVCLLQTLPVFAQTADPPAETRAIWAHVSMIPGDPVEGKARIEEWADRFARANLNTVYVWTLTDYLAALEDPSLQEAMPNATWDALGELTRACASRGLHVQAWFSFTYYKNRNSAEFRQNPAWRAVRLDELVPDPQTGQTHAPWFTDVCPSHPDARRFQLDLLEKVLDRYPEMTGIHIEEPGFGYPGNCFCDLCQTTFKALYGFDQKEKPDGPEATELKVLGTTAFMRDLRERMLKRDPSLVLTANGGYNWVGERRLGRDWARWARYGWLDGYTGQIYVHKPELLRERAAFLVGEIGRDTDVSVGINLVPPPIRPERLTEEQLTEFIETIRSSGASGIALFHAGIFTDTNADTLSKGPFREKAAPPVPRRLRGK